MKEITKSLEMILLDKMSNELQILNEKIKTEDIKWKN